MSDVQDLIQSALDQDYNKANEVFGDLMGSKISDALDQEKIKIASRIYGDEDTEDDDFEFDDEDLEFDDEEFEDDEIEEED